MNVYICIFVTVMVCLHIYVTVQAWAQIQNAQMAQMYTHVHVYE